MASERRAFRTARTRIGLAQKHDQAALPDPAEPRMPGRPILLLAGLGVREPGADVGVFVLAS